MITFWFLSLLRIVFLYKIFFDLGNCFSKEPKRRAKLVDKDSDLFEQLHILFKLSFDTLDLTLQMFNWLNDILNFQ